MRRETRKQPWQTFPFWFLILAGLAMTAAWKLDLFRSPPAEVAEEGVLEEGSEPAAPDWATSDASLEGVATIEQGEPVLDAEVPRSFPATEERVAQADTPANWSTTTPAKAADLDHNESAAVVPKASTKASDDPFAKSNTAKLKTVRNPNNPFGIAQTEFVPAEGAPERQPPTASNGWANGEPAEIEQASASEQPGAQLANAAAIEGQGTSMKPSPARPAKNVPATNASGSASADALEAELAKIDALIADSEDVEANFLLSNIYWKQPAARAEIMDRLRAVAYRIYFAPTPHFMEGHTVEPGDALQKIAKEHDISWEYLAKLNRTDAKKIRPGQKLKVIQGPFAAVVDLSDREVTIHSHGHFVASFEIGVGQDQPSPVGKFQVIDKQLDPTYYGADGVIDHDDPANPYGEHLLDLGENLGIHGTNDDKSLSDTTVPGCIRLRNRDVSDLYDLLISGSEVTIRR